MSYESSVEPIKLGYLNDITLSSSDHAARILDPLKLVFRDGHERGVIDRPVEIVYREVEGLPKGSVKAVVDAFGELVEAGCLGVIGPSITDNAVPVRKAIEQRFRIPCLSYAGSEEFLGEWTFALPAGSMSDEPRAWARLIAKRGCSTVGVLYDKSLVGELYLRNFRTACREEGLRILSEEGVAQTAQDVNEAVRKVHDTRPETVVYAGFGLGVLHVNPAMAALNWDPPRFMGTSWQAAFATPALWQALVGWIGLDQYDEGNEVGQRFFDRCEQALGKRPSSYSACIRHDAANIFLRAFADAHPLEPEGVKEALERVKLLPAASGARGTRISFGKWLRKGWVGTGFLIAREVDADGVTHRLVDRAIFD